MAGFSFGRPKNSNISSNYKVFGGGKDVYQAPTNSGQIGELFSKIQNTSSGGTDPNNAYRRFLESAQQAFRQGLLGDTASKFTNQAINTYQQAGQQENPLIDSAVKQAGEFINNPATNPYLENQINSYTNSVAKQVVPSAQSSFARAGWGVGSPQEKGAIAERIATATAPYATQALSGDFARRQGLQAQFTQMAPQIGAAPLQYQIMRAGAQQQAGALEEAEPSAYDELAKYQSLLSGANTYQAKQKPDRFGQTLGAISVLGGAALSKK